MAADTRNIPGNGYWRCDPTTIETTEQAYKKGFENVFFVIAGDWTQWLIKGCFQSYIPLRESVFILGIPCCFLIIGIAILQGVEKSPKICEANMASSGLNLCEALYQNIFIKNVAYW